MTTTVLRGTLDRDGFRLRWVREGAGIPMIVIGSERYYRPYFPASLRDHFDVVFCDSRQWASTPDAYDVSTITSDTICGDIEAVRQVVGFDRPIVMGQSQHGAMALEHARRHPAQVRGAVAIASAPPGVDDLMAAREAFVAADASAERLAVHAENLATRRVPDVVESTQDFVDRYVANGALGWFDPTFDATPLWEGVVPNTEVMDRIVGPDVLGRYELPLDVPVHVAIGRYDYGVPHHLWDEPARRHPNLELHRYDRSGHNPPYEEPEAFVAAVVEWATAL